MRAAADFFKILSDEVRVKMLWLLFHHQELCVCDIMETLGITQSKASRHLAALRHAGLITGRKEGLWSYYTLAPIQDGLIRSQLKTLREQLALRPEGAALLTRLHHCLKAKGRESMCPLPQKAKIGRVPGRRPS